MIIIKKINELEKTTLVFAIILGLIFIIFSLLSVYTQDSSVIQGIAEKVLDVLIPILIFNLFYEYLTRKYTSKNTSRMVSKTIMGNTEVIGAFEKKIRKNFIKTTLKTMLNDLKTNVLNNIIEKYIENEHNIKRYFDYDISFKEINDEFYDEIFNKNNYFWVVEYLDYTEVYNLDYLSNEEVKIVFSFDQNNIEEYFDDNNVIFREILSMENKDIKKLSNLFEQDSYDNNDIINEFFKLNLNINSEEIDFKNVNLIKGKSKDEIIAIVVSYNHPSISKKDSIENTENEFFVDYEITFRMPMCKKQNNLIVILSEPTYKPSIRFNYIKNNMTNISVIPFLDEEHKRSYTINHNKDKDILDFIKIDFNNWIIPRSGVVFTWDLKD